MFGNDAITLNALCFLLYIMFFDILTGFIKGNLMHVGKSETFFKGILKKILYFLCISFVIHVVTFYNLNSNISLGCISIFIMGEGYSVIENFIEMGVPVPEQIKKYFAVSNEVGNKNV